MPMHCWIYIKKFSAELLRKKLRCTQPTSEFLLWSIQMGHTQNPNTPPTPHRHPPTPTTHKPQTKKKEEKKKENLNVTDTMFFTPIWIGLTIGLKLEKKKKNRYCKSSQGKLTVDEYSNEFSRLQVRCALEEDDEHYVAIFTRGLRPSIRNNMKNARPCMKHFGKRSVLSAW